MKTKAAVMPTRASTCRPRARRNTAPRPRRLSHGKKTFGSWRWMGIGDSLLHELVHLDERHQDRECDESDAPAHDDDHERLEQARERLHARLDLGVIGARDVLEHLLELTAPLPDGDHVRHDRGEVAAP